MEPKEDERVSHGRDTPEDEEHSFAHLQGAAADAAAAHLASKASASQQRLSTGGKKSTTGGSASPFSLESSPMGAAFNSLGRVEPVYGSSPHSAAALMAKAVATAEAARLKAGPSGSTSCGTAPQSTASSSTAPAAGSSRAQGQQFSAAASHAASAKASSAGPYDPARTADLKSAAEAVVMEGSKPKSLADALNKAAPSAAAQHTASGKSTISSTRAQREQRLEIMRSTGSGVLTDVEAAAVLKYTSAHPESHLAARFDTLSEEDLSYHAQRVLEGADVRRHRWEHYDFDFLFPVSADFVDNLAQVFPDPSNVATAELLSDIAASLITFAKTSRQRRHRGRKGRDRPGGARQGGLRFKCSGR